MMDLGEKTLGENRMMIRSLRIHSDPLHTPYMLISFIVKWITRLYIPVLI